MPRLPDPDSSSLTRILRNWLQTPRPWHGVVFRSTSPRYARSTDLLSGEGARTWGGRWNPPGIRAVYGSLDAETAMAEALAHVRYYGIPEHSAMPRVFVAIEASLTAVVDLTDGELRRRLRVSRRALLLADRRAKAARSGEALTQRLGRAAHAAGVVGLLAPSAARSGGSNLVVFPDRLRPPDILRVLEQGWT
jgi:RES domain-containing protein